MNSSVPSYEDNEEEELSYDDVIEIFNLMDAKKLSLSPQSTPKLESRIWKMVPKEDNLSTSIKYALIPTVPYPNALGLYTSKQTEWSVSSLRGTSCLFFGHGTHVVHIPEYDIENACLGLSMYKKPSELTALEALQLEIGYGNTEIEDRPAKAKQAVFRLRTDQPGSSNFKALKKYMNGIESYRSAGVYKAITMVNPERYANWPRVLFKSERYETQGRIFNVLLHYSLLIKSQEGAKTLQIPALPPYEKKGVCYQYNEISCCFGMSELTFAIFMYFYRKYRLLDASYHWLDHDSTDYKNFIIRLDNELAKIRLKFRPWRESLPEDKPGQFVSLGQEFSEENKQNSKLKGFGFLELVSYICEYSSDPEFEYYTVKSELNQIFRNFIPDYIDTEPYGKNADGTNRIFYDS